MHSKIYASHNPDPAGRRLWFEILISDTSGMAETVLVIDDEATVRELLRRWLVGWGYAVTTAADAKEALETMLERPAEIMLADIKKPGHDVWLMEQVQAKWPRTVFIFAT